MSEKTIRILMVVTAVFWSGAFITGKLAIQEFPPFALTFFRFLFAFPIIYFILYIREPEQVLPHGRQWLPLILLGSIGTFCYHALFFSALQYTTVINSSLIGAMNPMVTTVLAILFFHEQLTRWRLVGIFLSFCGAFLIVTRASWQIISTFHFNEGDILMIFAVFSWAIYSLLSRYYMKKYQLSPLMVTTYTFLICVFVCIPFVVWEDPRTYLWMTTTGGWLSVLYMSVFASVIGYLIQMTAIQRIGAPRAAVFVNLVPVFTIIQSVLILGESLTVLTLIGAATVISGVYLALRPGTEKRSVLLLKPKNM